MLQCRVIPVLLLSHGGLVKTTEFKDPVYLGDPINAVKIFNEKGVDELIFLDITASLEERGPNFEVIREIASECFIPFAYGGGVRTLDHMHQLFNLGVEKIVVNSYAYDNPEFIRSAADVFGKQSIVVSLDAKKGFFGKTELYSHSGTRNTHQTPEEFARQMEAMGAGELFINSINRDGKMQGYDLDLVRSVSSAVRIPIIACGGAGSLEHFREATQNANASAVAAGSYFVFQGKHRAVLISYPARSEIERIFYDTERVSNE